MRLCSRAAVRGPAGAPPVLPVGASRAAPSTAPRWSSGRTPAPPRFRAALAAALVATSASAQDPAATAEAALAGLDLEGRVGQLILPRAPARFLHQDDPERRRLLDLAASGRIGGVVVFAGTPEGTLGMTSALQAAAPLPMLVAADYEWGSAMRTEGGIRFPPAMQAGAAPDPRALERQGRIVAREARAVGVHLVLAPVLDVLTSADSRVIGTRSFGSDPDVVASLGAAFLRGVEAGGALATAKHFPGHGGTETDSHFRLATVRADRETFERLHLAPFRAAVAAGVSAVMPGHLAAPALDGRDDRPAILSPEILGGLLRGEMGFDGLIVSDALEMEGARRGRFDGEVAVETLRAGMDVILVPEDPVVAHAAVVRAVRDGRLSESRLDEAGRRVLIHKARLGLFRDRAPQEPLPEAFSDPADRDFAASRFARGLVLLDDPEALLPFSTRITGAAPRTPRLLLVEVHRENPYASDRRHFRGALRRRGALLDRIAAEGHGSLPLGRFTEAAARADAVVVADFRRTGLSPPSALLEAVTPFAEKLVAVSFGNPHGVRGLPPEAAVVLAWDDAPAGQRAAAAALFGEAGFDGRLPVPLGERAAGQGRVVAAARQELSRVEPEEVGMSAEGLERVREVVRSAIAEGVTPGASAIVVRRGGVVLQEGFGRTTYAPDAPPVTPETIYDLASLTKVVGTTTLVMMLVEEGRVHLDYPVSAYLPEFLTRAPSAAERARRESVTVADLMAHCSGLPAWIQFYLEFDPEARGLPLPEARRMVFERILSAESDYEPRTDTIYSDNGILLVGEIIERVTGGTLDMLVGERLFGRLGMADTGYRPAPELAARIAPTEDNPWRGRVVHGQVHDENTVVLGEVAAHAGLFSTTGDLAVFLQMLLNGGSMRGERLLQAATIARFTRRAERAPGSSRALGWDTPSRSSSGGPSSAGDLFSRSSFGHTGFTGTSIWVDPERELFAVLLTNRVHPTRENGGIVRLRPAFHDAVIGAIGDGS